MLLSRCPICHAKLSIDQLCQDEAGREMLAILMKLDSQDASAVVSYIGLFRSATRDLANDRALKLMHETLEIDALHYLIPALQETVESLREKRCTGEVKALTNHNYLKRVLESVKARGEITPKVVKSNQSPAYRSASASMDRLVDTSWAG